jgi:dipeptidase E
MQMNLILTSDFPSTGNEHVFECMRTTSAQPRIAWIPPFTDSRHERFAHAQKHFGSFGFDRLEYCDIDEETNHIQLSQLEQYDIIYLTGGDPIRFRRNILRIGLSGRLQQCLVAQRLVVAASGGSMQLTKNVSLFRLLTETIDTVLANRTDYQGLGMVEYEFLPHLNKCEPDFLEQVRCYSQRVDCDVIALEDGAAVVHSSRDHYQCVGQVVRYSKGVLMPINTTA